MSVLWVDRFGCYCRFLPQYRDAAKTGIALSLQSSFEPTIKTMLVRVEPVDIGFMFWHIGYGLMVVRV